MTPAGSGSMVILGFAESLAAVEAAWDLVEHGYQVHAFTRRGTRPALARDARIRLHEVEAPENDADATVDEIDQLSKVLGHPPMLPTDDVALWLLDSVKKQNAAAVVAGPTGEQARAALDKRIQLAAAAQAGLLVPTTLIHDGTGAPTVPVVDSSWVGSWIIKPALAVEIADGRVRRGRAEFGRGADRLRDALADRSDVVLVQPVVNGVGHGVFGHVSSGGVQNWSAHRRVRMMNPSGSGSSAARSTDPDRSLLGPAQEFLRGLGWQGLFMLEFLEDGGGRAWFMELNGRTWGSLPLAVRRGLSYPTWAVQQALDPSFTPPDLVPGPHITARHIGREILHVGFVARGRRRAAGARRAGEPADPSLATYPSVGRAAASVVRWSRNDRAYNYRRGQLRVFAADTWLSVRGAFGARGR